MKKINPEIELEPLSLPIRYENLEREAASLGIDITTVVEKVDHATDEIEKLLQQINHGKNGKFKIFLGDSGKGKTTFLKTLSKFFQKIELLPIDRSVNLSEIPEYIIEDKPTLGQTIAIIEDRDNPNESSEELRIFFEELRFRFRKELHDVLIIWPITDSKAAEDISKIAWDVGRDSMTSNNDCIYNFQGIPKEVFYRVADITSINLNEGRNLESYNISELSTANILKKSETIGQFFSGLSEMSREKNESLERFLKDKKVPKVWILLPGDDAREIDHTVRNLTRGIKYRLDIERILAALDDKKNVSAYLSDWRNRRADASHLLHLLDVRLLPIPPSLSLSAIRAFGDDEIKANLKTKSEGKQKVIEEMKKSVLYQLLLNEVTSVDLSPRKTNEKTSAEYLRVQQDASKLDKKINEALGIALSETFISEGIHIKLITERKCIEGSNMKPDIQIHIDDNIICLEPTWRTSGQEIKSEGIASKSNSLSTGHLQKYILEKVMDYVKSIDL